MPLKEIIEFVSSDEVWLQAVRELSKCEDPKKRLITFESFLVTENKTEKTITDFKSHFSKWLPFEMKREKEKPQQATKIAYTPNPDRLTYEQRIEMRRLKDLEDKKLLENQ